ncbi:MAG: DUF1569 domain-containing protein [Filimonas sp.]|nr:DUF1569 domain-containing protein [Filimonas sp.]
MKTIFDETVRLDIIERINSLRADSKACWGKMDVAQMMKHCAMSDEAFLGKKTYKRIFIGRLLGGAIIKSILKDSQPLRQNQPTVPELRITEDANFITEKSWWISLVHEYGNFSNDNFIHPFFGKMTKKQVGELVYKHLDHHLRQFNA